MRFETRVEIITVFIVGIFLLISLIGYIVYFLLQYQKKLQKHLLEKQSLQAQYQESLLLSQVEIQEQTLQHISRELHDNLGQVASLIKINLNTLQLSKPDKAQEKIENSLELTRQLIFDLKSLSVRLGSDRLTQTGLAKAIEAEVDHLNKTGQFNAEFELEGMMPGIDNDKKIILYRMVQEILNNIVKHSSAGQIKISLKTNNNLLILAFDDNGIGFDVEEKMNAPGAGLRNLKNRALLINAQLNIQSYPGKGTQVMISLPV